ncbi:GyrI-like domain-containing protein [Candidatus Cytomitobacter primus]|uniref:AraC family transcriptional regulator n=1 Tax=Candidatus Cytomitobacter primus TaxID=2066024 RepID=A0A5C0UIN0_9PROT|nr:effector binding domain-containing protein [Candidatus Cytomitobacter primus]QEK38734.1 AraC family transcriptional regulator [Candidatus Cytomitobacter primus]
MNKKQTTLLGMKLIGISVKTSNANEMDPTKGKILNTINQYLNNDISSKIPNRKNPGVMYCVYANYEKDEHDEYTYFVGEEVYEGAELVNADSDALVVLNIPVQSYMKFTEGPGEMPGVCISAWRKIWGMNSSDLGGERAYIADFEVYDERAKDPSNSVFDIYVGIKSS